jgi:hypothetical protein
MAMESDVSVPREIDPDACGGYIAVAADRQSASCETFGAFPEPEPEYIVRLTGGPVRGRLRLEFRVDGDNDVRFGYGLEGSSFAKGYVSDVGTQWASENLCVARGVRVPDADAPFEVLPVGGSAALLFDKAAGTLAYEVNGVYVGVLFRNLENAAVVPIFALYYSGRHKTVLTITRAVENW